MTIHEKQYPCNKPLLILRGNWGQPFSILYLKTAVPKSSFIMDCFASLFHSSDDISTRTLPDDVSPTLRNRPLLFGFSAGFPFFNFFLAISSIESVLVLNALGAFPCLSALSFQLSAFVPCAMFTRRLCGGSYALCAFPSILCPEPHP